MTQELFKATRDHRGFAVIESKEFRDISFDRFLQETEKMNEGIRPLHEFVRSCSLTSYLGGKGDDKGWNMVTPDGYKIAMTANAFKEISTRAGSPRQPAVGYFPVLETNIGKVALTTRSDQYAMMPDGDLVSVARQVARRYDQSDIQMATLSPDKVSFSVQTDILTMGNTDDEIGTGFTIINSHTGQASVTVGDFIERLICTNGMTDRTGGNTLTRTQHKWAGLSKWTLDSLRGKLASGEITSLPTKSKDYLEKGAIMAMSKKTLEDVHKRVSAIIKSSKLFVDSISSLATREISHDDMMKYTNDLLQVMTNETKAEEFEKRFGLKQQKAILRNVGTYSRSVRNSANRLYEELSGTQWTLPNAFNDQPQLKANNLPLTVRDFAVELGSSIAIELVNM